MNITPATRKSFLFALRGLTVIPIIENIDYCRLKYVEQTRDGELTTCVAVDLTSATLSSARERAVGYTWVSRNSQSNKSHNRISCLGEVAKKENEVIVCVCICVHACMSE